jgi:hypothetical protein
VDTTAPTVAIASPAASSTVSGTATVNVNAADNVGVARVELYVNNTVVASDTAAPYSFSLDTTGVANGLATLTAVAYDAAGNAASSTPLSLNVANAAPVPVKDTVKPVVKITNPVPGKISGSVIVKVDASDNMGPAGITLSIYVDGVKRASGSGSTMAYTWNTDVIAAGTHTLYAVARDAAGNSSMYYVQVSK